MAEGRTLSHRVVAGERLTDAVRGHGHVIRVEGDEADIIWNTGRERVKLPPEQVSTVRLYIPYLCGPDQGYVILDWPKSPYTPEDVNAIRKEIAEGHKGGTGVVIPLGFQVLE